MSRKLTTEEFVIISEKSHGKFYDYRHVIYTGNKCKVEIHCPIHGRFVQTASHHMRGIGCNLCGRERTRVSHLLTNTEEFIRKARLRHGQRYCYKDTDLAMRAESSMVDIICNKHGKFQQEPVIHLAGHGCFDCGRETIQAATIISPDDILRRAKMIHGNVYTYDLHGYRNTKDKISITCPLHGVFKQTADGHINARHSCPKCSSLVWRKENQWLDNIGVPDTQHTRQVRIRIGNKTIIADGFDPDTNTIYEFWGDFWHGNLHKYNPDDVNPVTKTTFGELHATTLQKIDIIRGLGYNLISIWESEYDEIAKVGR